MKRNLRDLVIFLGMLAAAAWVAPLLYPLLHQFKFKRILSRCLMIAVLCFTGYLGWSREWKPRAFLQRVGLTGRGERKKIFCVGFFLGTGVLFLIVWALALLSIREWRTGVTFGSILPGLVLAFVAALLIAVIEDVFFQGLLLPWFFEQAKWGGLVLSNVIYASAHFFHGASVFVDDTPTFWDSLRSMGAYFSLLADPMAIWPAFLGLFIFGAILSFAFLGSRNLLFSIGLHAGVVFAIKSASLFSVHVTEMPSLLYGSADIYDGALAWAFLAVLLLIVVRWAGRLRQSTRSNGSGTF